MKARLPSVPEAVTLYGPKVLGTDAVMERRPRSRGKYIHIEDLPRIRQALMEETLTIDERGRLEALAEGYEHLADRHGDKGKAGVNHRRNANLLRKILVALDQGPEQS